MEAKNHTTEPPRFSTCHSTGALPKNVEAVSQAGCHCGMMM